MASRASAYARGYSLTSRWRLHLRLTQPPLHLSNLCIVSGFRFRAAIGGQYVETARSKISLLTISRDSITKTHERKVMQYNIGTILAVIAIILVLATYLTGAPLVPVAVILLALAIIFGGNAFRRV